MTSTYFIIMGACAFLSIFYLIAYLVDYETAREAEVQNRLDIEQCRNMIRFNLICLLASPGWPLIIVFIMVKFFIYVFRVALGKD